MTGRPRSSARVGVDRTAADAGTFSDGTALVAPFALSGAVPSVLSGEQFRALPSRGTGPSWVGLLTGHRRFEWSPLRAALEALSHI